MRLGRAHDTHMQHVCKGDVGRKTAGARDQDPIFKPRNRAADEAHFTPAACSAARIFLGVAGSSSMDAPKGEIASLMALRIAAGAPMVPPSPSPFALVTDP